MKFIIGAYKNKLVVVFITKMIIRMRTDRVFTTDSFTYLASEVFKRHKARMRLR